MTKSDLGIVETTTAAKAAGESWNLRRTAFPRLSDLPFETDSFTSVRVGMAFLPWFVAVPVARKMMGMADMHLILRAEAVW